MNIRVEQVFEEGGRFIYWRVGFWLHVKDTQTGEGRWIWKADHRPGHERLFFDPVERE